MQTMQSPFAVQSSFGMQSPFAMHVQNLSMNDFPTFLKPRNLSVEEQLAFIDEQIKMKKMIFIRDLVERLAHRKPFRIQSWLSEPVRTLRDMSAKRKSPPSILKDTGIIFSTKKRQPCVKFNNKVETAIFFENAPPSILFKV